MGEEYVEIRGRFDQQRWGAEDERCFGYVLKYNLKIINNNHNHIIFGNVKFYHTVFAILILHSDVSRLEKYHSFRKRETLKCI